MRKGDGYISSYDFKYEPEAMRNAPAPHSLTGIDLLAYYALCYVYRLYKDKAIDRPTGTKMKQSLLQAYKSANRTKDKYDFIWARLEQSARDYAMNPTKETADVFYARVYNLNDDWRNDRNKKAVEGVAWEQEKIDNAIGGER
jgi:hypothetical protein